jgi:flagellar basal-body rod protein FlgB
MDIESVPLFAMLKSRMGYLNQRQQVIAENVANASTPGFVPQDLQPFTTKSSGGSGGLALAQPAQSDLTRSGSGEAAGMIAFSHSSSSDSGSSDFKAVQAPDADAELNGNQVVLEQQMLKMNETRSQYDIAVGLYQKAMGFLQLAAQEPGK